MINLSFAKIRANLLYMRMRGNIIIMALLLAAVMACYAAVLNAGFVWDDEYIISRNPLLRAPLWSFQIFKQDIVNSGFTYTIYYRPVQILSYAIDYRLWGMDPFGFHLSNLFLHFLNCVLIFLLAQRFTGKRAVSFLAALLFAIHPAHTGAVSYISGRADLLFFFFGLSSMIFFILFKEKKRGILLAGSVFLFALSLLSKEAAIVFPFLVLLMDAVILRKKWGFDIRCHIPIFLLAGGYWALHRALFGGRYGAILRPGQITENLLGYLRMAGEFLVLGVFPFGVHIRRTLGQLDQAVLALTIIGICFVLLVIYLKKNRRILLFSAGFFLIALLPLIFVVGHFKVLGEHWMYLASFGIFLFLAAAIGDFYERGRVILKAASTAAVFAAVFFYSASTIGESTHWRDDIALSRRVLASSINDFAAMHFKAVSDLKSGKAAQSLHTMSEYVRHNPEDSRAWYIKGRLALAAGKTDEAERDFSKAAGINPNSDNAQLGLALVAFAKSRHQEGVRLLERAIEINPRYSEAFLLLVTAYSRTGESEKAFEAARKANRINPYDFDSMINLGTAYTHQGKLRQGARLYLEASKLYPERPLSYYNLGYIFYISGQKEEGEKWLRKAVMVDPGFKPAVELLHRISEE